jgi:uncharacterized Ntn-hydrolase superfamily protein
LNRLLAALLLLWVGALASVPLLARPGQPAQSSQPKQPASAPATSTQPPQLYSTYSIVAYDPDRKEWGVGVASKVLAVGAGVQALKAGVGAIATQSYANLAYGPKAIALLAEGKSAEEVIKILTDADKNKEFRQVGVVDREGRVANFTGSKCIAWAGAKAGKHYTCQGNLLANEKVIADMAETFENTKGRLAWRIMAALDAAEAAGGDKRGRQSAAIHIVGNEPGELGYGEHLVNLRVDDAEEPLVELRRLLTKRLGKPQ